MKFSTSDLRSHRWGLILAGGNEKRLLPLTRRVARDERPKKFCSTLGDETLLRQTRRRVSRLVQPWRTLLVLTKTHEPFYADEVAGIPSAPAILYSLMRLREMDPDGVVAFFPSDHHFSDDEAFVGHIDSAYAARASARSGVVVLLRIPPETPQVEYGWIEPGIPLGAPVPESVCRVSRFWEKPHGTLAAELMERGCLWNSFVIVCGRRSRFPQSHPASASMFDRRLRIQSAMVIHGLRENGIERALLQYWGHQLFSGCVVGSPN